MSTSLEKALAGDRAAITALVGELSPVIQARATRALLRRREAAGNRDARQEVRDLVQQVFLVLFAEDGRVLRQWDPARGMSLENFVGLVAEREVASILRRRRRSPWGEDPTADEHLDRLEARAPGPESHALSRDLLRSVVEAARARLSERGLEMLEWIVIEGRSVDEVCVLAAMTPDAVYAWRSRLARLLREIAVEMTSDPGASRRKPMEGRT
jgi:DNA-directed RNA polymerase specialized sigma24 family protein